jgi:3-(3-hydroxy-phenyl)propionate hydroxylase
MRRDRFDVCIVGAGPSGLTLAHLLSLHGVSVVIAEQNATTVQEPRAVSIDDESLRTMQTVGLAEAVLKDCASGYGSSYYGPDGRCFLQVSPSRSEYGWPKRSAFRQPMLEATLVSALRGKTNVSLRFGTRCTGFEETDSNVVVTLEDADGARQIECSYLVGCDGARSDVRKAIGAELKGSSFEERWLIVDLLDTRDNFRETRVFCDPMRAAISLPGPERRRRFEFKLHSREKTEEMEREMRARSLLAQFGPDRDAVLDRVKVYAFHARVADHWRKGRVFLAGDAAHLTPPFAGQGMNAGLRDSANLAWKLAAVLSGYLGPGLLTSYESERRDHAWAMIKLAMAMGFVMGPPSRLAGALTRAVFRAASIVPAARDWLAQMRFKPKPRFKDGFFVAHDDRARRLAGTMFPQARVELGRIETKLDDILGPGFACLCYGENPAALATSLDAIPAWLRATLVGCLPRTIAFPAQPFDTVIRDSHGEIARALGGLSEAVIVLRPDRYVAAVIAGDSADNTIASLKQMITGTFDKVATHGEAPAPDAAEGRPAHDGDPILPFAAPAAGKGASGSARTLAGTWVARGRAMLIRRAG